MTDVTPAQNLETFVDGDGALVDPAGVGVIAPIKRSAGVKGSRKRAVGMTDTRRASIVRALLWTEEFGGKKPDRPSSKAIADLVKHYRTRPFDMIRDGCLSIIDKEGERVRFILNDEQSEVLALVEREYYAKRPVRVIVLKGRQIGMSTLNMAISFVLTITSSHKSGHLVTHRKSTNLNLMRMFRNYYKYCPDGLKPKLTTNNEKMVEFEDPEFGVDDSRIVVDSAENRDKLSLGYTFQFNNFSEKAMWPDQAMVAGALKPTIPKRWPSVIIEESTGDKFNDLFHTEYAQAKKGIRAGWFAKFFPVQSHKEYRMALTVSPEEFVAAMSEEDKIRMHRFKVSLEFMNWYITEREDWCSQNRETAAVFRRMYPMCEEEAFWGAGSSFYDPGKLDITRDRVRHQKLGSLSVLPASISVMGMREVKYYARCETIKNQLSRYKGAAFMESANGEWVVWERPRKFHRYVIGVDIAEGKEKIPGLRTTNDFSVITVLRYTYSPDEVPAIVQVAQLRSQTIDPWELEQEAMAASVMYSDFDTGENALVCPERNGPGLAFIGQGKKDGMNFYMKQRGITVRGAQIDSEEIGFQSTGGEAQGSRISVLIQGREAWVQGLLLLSSLDTVDEMSVFSKNEKGKFEAQGTNHDDTIFGFTYALECVRYKTQVVAPVPLGSVEAKQEGMDQVVSRFAPPPKLDIRKWLEQPGVKLEEEVVASGSYGF